ncbi:MAG TPA: Rieske (2Fe-2S) protein [Terriglobia bacterium]
MAIKKGNFDACARRTPRVDGFRCQGVHASAIAPVHARHYNQSSVHAAGTLTLVTEAGKGTLTTMTPEFVKCADLSDLAPGSCRTVQVAGSELALFNVEGTIYCLDNTCLHRGGPLGEGVLEGDVITCPWHSWQYNVRTGENLFNPAVKVTSHSVLVDGEDIKVAVASDR